MAPHRRGVVKVVSYEAFCDVCGWGESFGDEYDPSAESKDALGRARRALKAHRCPSVDVCSVPDCGCDGTAHP